jgi:hypothetical protein
MCLTPHLVTRVQISPAYDLWMRGARYGTVERYSRDKQTAYVRLDKMPNKLLKFPVDDLTFY